MLFTAITSIVLFQAFATVMSDINCTEFLPKDKYTKVFQNTCYRFILYHPLEYQEANKVCKSFIGVLASVTSKEVNDFLYESFNSLLYPDQAWIGLNDIEDENTFVWEDESPLNYTNWADENEGPRSGTFHFLTHNVEDCVAMDMKSYGKWRDYACTDYLLGPDERKPFVCQIQNVKHKN